jgi:hypothetical protein
LIEERAVNVVNSTGKIPAKRKVARVVLIPKPGPTLTSSFWPISVLSKVWEQTFKGLIEESLGLDRFQEDNMGSEGGGALLTPCAE